MRIVEASLWNICQHKELYCHFGSALNAIVGPNGSGKSNVLAAIYWAITGDTKRFRLPNKASVISQYAKDTEDSGVKVTLRHNNLSLYLSRFIRPQRREFTIVDGNTGERKYLFLDKDITQALEGLLGVPMSVLGKYAFVDQWEMFSLLNSSPAERASELYTLFDIDKAEDCYDLLGSRISSLEAEAPAIDVDSVNSRLMSSRIKLKQLESSLTGINSILPQDYSPSIDPAMKTITDWNQKLKLNTEFDLMTETLKNLEIEKEKLKTELVNLELNLDSLKLNLPKQDSISQSNHLLKSWQVYEQMVRNKTGLSDKATKLTKELDSLELPVKPEFYYSEEEDRIYNKELSDIRFKLMEAESYIAAVGEGSCCPTCKTSSDKFAGYKEECKVCISRYKNKLVEKERIRSSVYKYRHDRDVYLQQKERLSNSLDFVKEQLNSLPDMPAPTQKKEDIEKILLETTRIQALVLKMEPQKATLSTKIANLEGQIEITRDSIAKIELKRFSLNITQEQVDRATITLSETQKLYKQRATLVSEISVIKRSIFDDETSIEDSAKALNKRLKVESWKTELTKARNILHRSELPQDIAQSHLYQMEETMNSTLVDLGVDFRVKSKDSLKFIAEFDDGRKLAAESLSGGEKVVFALAWRLAVNSHFASDIGILCLDEPTAGLDKDRLGCLKTALEKMRTLAENQGLQCIIITHETDLMPLFDDVIELKAPINKI